MPEVKVCSFPPGLTLSYVDQRLQELDIGYRIERHSDRQELYVDDRDLGSVTRLLDELRAPEAQRKSEFRWTNVVGALKRAPMSYSLVILALIVFVAQLNPTLEFWTYWLMTFTGLAFVGGHIEPLTWQQTYLIDHQWWRLLSPIFLHFGFAHIIFNTMAIIEFGRRIEHLVTFRWIALAVVIIAVGSNTAQFLGSPAPFGGLSGVAYGFFGLVLSLARRSGHEVLSLPRGFVPMMLIMLMLGPLGVFEMVFGISLANHAHFGGLILGALIGVLIPYRANRNVKTSKVEKEK